MLSLFNFFLSTWRILKLNLQYFIYISSLKPGSHMPPTYLIPLRHGWTFIAESYSFQGIYRQLACEVELTQASRRLSAIKMLYWTSSVGATYPRRRFDPSVPVEWLKIAPVQFAICANLSTSAIYRRCAGDQQIVERCQFQPQASQPLDIRNYCCIRMFSAWKRNTFTANICYFIMTEFDYAKQHMKVLCYNCLNL